MLFTDIKAVAVQKLVKQLRADACKVAGQNEVIVILIGEGILKILAYRLGCGGGRSQYRTMEIEEFFDIILQNEKR